MARPYLEGLPRFNTIGPVEIGVVEEAMGGPLSGYIGGNPKGGHWVEKLADDWRTAFSVPYAIPCNSATSGLLAACMAVGVGPRDEVWTTPYSMSATAACARVLGATVRFIDIERDRFGIDVLRLAPHPNGQEWLKPDGWAYRPKAIIVTNLFGHPARLKPLKDWCDTHKVWLIEDNAQAPMAMEEGRYAGTIGHIGVFSLNVHKHIQCGEGGIIVASSKLVAERLECAINHGELAFGATGYNIGLNLRMTEPIAAIACAQLAKATKIIEERRAIGLELCDMVKDVPWLKAHTDQPGCKHVYYLWTALADSSKRALDLVAGLNDHGVPIRWSYAPLLHQLFKSGDKCPVAEDIDSRIIVYENCAYAPNWEQLNTMREIFKRVTGELDDRASALAS